MAPTRILDSRTSLGGWNGKLTSSARDLTVTPTVPNDATAVVMNVTVTDVPYATYVTAYPTGQVLPNASNLNASPGQTIANLVTVKIGTNNKVRFYNAVGAVNLIADVVGYYSQSTGDGFVPESPVRILDSRGSTGGWNHKLGAGDPGISTLKVTGGASGVPSNADAVIMNVTVTDVPVATFLTVFPTGSPIPTASNINAAPSNTIPNLVTVKVGSGGNVSFRNQNGSINVIADVVGYYSPTTGDKFHALSPVRALDSRTSIGGWHTTLKSGTANARSLPISSASPSGLTQVSANATAAIMNVTVTDVPLPTFLTVYPNGQSTPNASNLNASPGQTIPNLVAVKLGTSGAVKFYNAQGSVNVIADVVGFFAPN